MQWDLGAHSASVATSAGDNGVHGNGVHGNAVAPQGFVNFRMMDWDRVHLYNQVFFELVEERNVV